MKFRNKFLAGFAATILALSMMIGTALASTDKLPFTYGNEAGVATNNDVWVVLYGGAAATPLTDDVALRDSVTSVDIVVTGKCSFDAELVANCQSGWAPKSFPGQTVDGELAINLPLAAKDQGWVEVVVNLQNKTEGALEVTRLDFKDADGNVVLSHGAASKAADAPKADAPKADAPKADAPKADAPKADAPKATAVPKTGVASLGLIFGLGAAVLGSSTVVLKKKEK